MEDTTNAELELRQKFEQSLEKVTAENIQTSSTGVVPKEWENTTFGQYLQLCKISEIPSLEDGVTFGRSFLNYIINAEKIEGVGDVMRGLITACRCPTVTEEGHNQIAGLFDDEIVSSSARKITLPNPLKRDPTNFTPSTAFKEGGLIYFVSNALKDPETIEEVKRFYTSLWNLSLGTADDKDIFVSFLAYYAMHLVRLCVKSPDVIINIIRKDLLNKYKNLWGNILDLDQVVAPHKDALARLQAIMGRGSKVTLQILPLLIHETVREPTKRQVQKAIIKSACTITLGKVGLGPLSWLAKATSGLSSGQVKEMYIDIATTETVKTIMKVTDHLANYKDDLYWPYARLLDDGYFSHLSTANNLPFTMTMACLAAESSSVAREYLSLETFSKASDESKKQCMAMGAQLRIKYGKGQ